MDGRQMNEQVDGWVNGGGGQIGRWLERMVMDD